MVTHSESAKVAEFSVELFSGLFVNMRASGLRSSPERTTRFSSPRGPHAARAASIWTFALRTRQHARPAPQSVLMSINAGTILTADGMPILAHDLCDQAAQAAAWMLLEEGKSTLRTALLTGSHGAGKSTQLKLIDQQIRQAGATVSWFNGWADKEDADPFASMLFSL